MSRRAATRRHEISESVAIKWLERVERDGSRRSARRMRPEKPSGRVGKPAYRARFRPDCPRGFLGGTSRWTISGDLEP
jgi:transposase